MRRMILGVAGHRPQRLGGFEQTNPTRDLVVEKLRELLARLNSNPPGIIVEVGMALGVDFWTCSLCTELGIPYVAVVPFKGAESKWSRQVQEQYNQLLRGASKVVYVSEPPYEPRKMLIRNEWLVEHADKVLVVWTGERSGTGHVAYTAVKAGKPTIMLNPQDGSLSKIDEEHVNESWELIPF